MGIAKKALAVPTVGAWPQVRRIPAIAVVLLFFVLWGAFYGLSTPVFEGPDEQWHFSYAQYLVQKRHLPSPSDPDAAAMQQEVTQPPLPYILYALVTAPIDTSDYPTSFPRNRHFPAMAHGWEANNKNYFAHSVDEDFPWHGAALAVRVGRWLAILLSALAVLGTYLLGRELWPGDRAPALAAALLLAVTPTFLYIGGMFSNDGPAAALAALALWLMARNIRRGLARGRVIALGILIGLSILSKASSLLLLAPGLLAVTWAWYREVEDAPRGLMRALPRLLGYCVVLLAAVAVLAGWLYVRNYHEFGDALGIRPHTETAWAESKPTRLPELISRLPRVWDTYWGAFGWGNINFQDWVSTIHTNLARLAVVGLLLAAVDFARGRRFPGDWLRSAGLGIVVTLLLAVAVMLVALLRWNQIVEAPWGRLMFPAAAAISVLLVAGWRGLCLALWRWLRRYVPAAPARVAAWLPLVFVVGMAVAAPFTLIRPAYARPPLLTPAQAAALQPQLDFRAGDVARLVSAQIEPTAVAAGEPFTVTLCWEPLRRTDAPLSQFVQVVGQNDRLVGAGRRTYPGLGSYPTSGWKIGGVFCDRVAAAVAPEEIRADQPELFQIEVGFYWRDTGDRLPTQDSTGKAITGFVDRIKIRSLSPYVAHPSRVMDADFGGQIRLLGYDLPASVRPGDSVPLSLYWQAAEQPAADYQVFIHLLDASGKQVAQFDGPPRGGVYPTSAWDAGESVPDAHSLALPAGLAPGLYGLRLGLYRLDGGERLPATGAGAAEGGAVLLPLEVHAP